MGKFLHCQLLLQNHWMPSNQSYHYCSSKGSEEGYLFEAIKNPRWLYWPLVGRYIFDFFSSTTACEASRLDRNDPQKVLKKSYCFSERFEIQHGCPRQRHFFNYFQNYFIWRIQLVQWTKKNNFNFLSKEDNYSKKSLKIPKRSSESLNRKSKKGYGCKWIWENIHLNIY